MEFRNKEHTDLQHILHQWKKPFAITMAVRSVEEGSDSNHLVMERIGNFYDCIS